jgi:zinc protease
MNGDPKKCGLAEMTAAMMNEATLNHTTEEISAELERLGSTISFDAGKTSTDVMVSSLTKNLDATLKLLEEKLLRPKFDAEDFKRVKKQYIEGLVSEKKQAETVAGNLYEQLLYGDNIMGAYVSDKNVRGFKLEELKAYYDKYYSPNVTKMVVVGDVSQKDILTKLAFLENWKSKDISVPAVATTFTQQNTTIYLAHKENAAQSVLYVGHPGLKYDATGDFYKSTLMNFPFGGAFNSRLNLNLREAKGYTYGIRSGFDGDKYIGDFSIRSSVKRSATDTCVTEIMKEWKGFKDKGMTEEELMFTKNSILNGEALKYESQFQKASYLGRIIEYDLPADFSQKKQQILRDATLADMNGLAKQYLHPENAVILVVGNKYVLKDRLEKLGYGKVKEISMD